MGAFREGMENRTQQKRDQAFDEQVGATNCGRERDDTNLDPRLAREKTRGSRASKRSFNALLHPCFFVVGVVEVFALPGGTPTARWCSVVGWQMQQLLQIQRLSLKSWRGMMQESLDKTGWRKNVPGVKSSEECVGPIPPAKRRRLFCTDG